MNYKFWALISRLPDLDQEIFQGIINSYENRLTHETVDKLRKLAINRFPTLRENQYNKDINFEDFISKHNLIKREEYNEDIMEKIKVTKDTIESTFPSPQYFTEYRINTKERVAEKEKTNCARVHMDTIGFRIAPNKAIDIIEVINWIENQQKWKILLKLNTIALSRQEFKKLFEPNSSSLYQAIHYYIDIGGACAEVQLRTPAIHQWSNLHHMTHYKPIIQTTNFEKKLVMQFGEMANWVDFKALSS